MQPLKLASMEGLWESTSCAPLYLVGWVDEATQTTTGISIPCLLSVLAYQDPQAMVAGHQLVRRRTRSRRSTSCSRSTTSCSGWARCSSRSACSPGFLYCRKRRLFTARWMLWILVVTVFFVEAAIIAGWWTAEVGRQPWVVYNVLATADGVSPTLSTPRRRDLARDVHRAVRDPARPVPVPAQPRDPARARAARGSSRPSTARPCPTRSARSSPAATAPARAEKGDAVRDLVRPVRRSSSPATSSSTASTWASGSCCSRWRATTPSGGPCSTASARSGTATRSGSSSRAACCSRCSRSRMRRCSRGSTSRSCSSCS